MNTPNQDPLQRCLLALARHHGEATSAEALISGLPLEHGRLTPFLFARAAARANLTANVVNRWPAQVSEDLLPAVILSEAEQACVLMGWSADGEVAQVIYPDLPEAEVAVARADLEAFSNGSAILCKPKFKFDSRAPKQALVSEEHWFWSAVKRNLPVYRDVLVAAFFINVFALALPLFTMNVYDRVVCPTTQSRRSGRWPLVF